MGALRLGVGGPVGSGKTALVAELCRRLGGEFEIRSFRHRARYDETLHRIEMHLESRREQAVRIRDLGIEVPFAKGETIHTESSYRFDEEGVEELARATGFRVLRSFCDRERRFASFLLGAGFAAGASPDPAR